VLSGGVFSHTVVLSLHSRGNTDHDLENNIGIAKTAFKKTKDDKDDT